jgi:hypothetical protein
MLAKGPGVHQRGRALQRLHQVGLDRLLHQHGQRAGAADVFGGDRVALPVQADHHAAKALAHVVERGGERQNRHDLTGHGDVEAGLARAPLLLRPLAHSDLAQRAVVGVHHAAPGDGGRIDVQAHEAADLLRRQVVGVGLVDAQFLEAQQHGAGEVALAAFGRAEALEEGGVVHVRLMEHARVDGRSQQVVGCGDGVQVAGEMQVELLHRDHLAVAAARRAALDAEGRSLAGLADVGEDLLAQVRA